VLAGIGNFLTAIALSESRSDLRGVNMCPEYVTFSLKIHTSLVAILCPAFLI
jgi:hypothetical protein